MPESKRRMSKREVQAIRGRGEEIARDEMERRLDKLHVTKMARACMGIVVSLAFNDEQALRAACWFVGHCALQLGKTREAVLEQVGLAYELVQADNGKSENLSGLGIVAPDGTEVQ